MYDKKSQNYRGKKYKYILKGRSSEVMPIDKSS